MPFADSREFLQALRDHGELLDIDSPVALELEVAKAMRKSAAIAGPALLFKRAGAGCGERGCLRSSVRSVAYVSYQR